MKIAIKDINSSVKYLYILFIILLSKTVYFGLVNEYVTTAIVILLVFLLLLSNPSCQKNNIKSIIVFIGIHIMLACLNFKSIDSGFLLSIAKRIVYLMVGFIAAMILKRNELKKIYVNILCGISIISLMCKIVQLLNPGYVSSICTYVSLPQRYYYTFFYTFGRTSSYDIRNYGPFWEPGGYQIFLNIALLFLIFGDHKSKNLKLLLLVGTIATTGSTAGYIVLLIILLFSYKEMNLDIFKGKNAIFFVAILIIGLVVMFSGNINGKLTLSETNSSLRDRLVDLQYGIELVKTHPLIGYGTTNLATENVNNIYYANSNGILSLAFSFGIPYACLFIYYIVKGFTELLQVKKKKYVVMIILVILIIFITEESNALAVMYCFLYNYKNDKLAFATDESNYVMRGERTHENINYYSLQKF
ncbi:MAG: O-antigen ligase family protein [Lachnospiraceae bacterium]|nr:O-antigen ligase family protein [Lachnospiraceae bacterium]